VRFRKILEVAGEAHLDVLPVKHQREGGAAPGDLGSAGRTAVGRVAPRRRGVDRLAAADT
jgi:hypothetical protein